MTTERRLQIQRRAQQKYGRTVKGKATARRYDASDKAKAKRARYRATPEARIVRTLYRHLPHVLMQHRLEEQVRRATL